MKSALAEKETEVETLRAQVGEGKEEILLKPRALEVDLPDRSGDIAEPASEALQKVGVETSPTSPTGESALKAVETALAAERTALARVTAEYEKLVVKHDLLVHDKTSLENERDRLDGVIQDLKGETGVSEDIKKQRAEANKLKEALSRAHAELASIRLTEDRTAVQVSNASRDVFIYQEEIDTAENDLKVLKEQLHESLEAQSVQRRECQDLKTAAIEFKAQSLSLFAEKTALVKELGRDHRFHGANGDFHSKFVRLDEERQNAVDESEGKEALHQINVNRLQTEIQNLERRLNKATEDGNAQKTADRVSAYEIKIKLLRDQVKESDQKLSKLQERYQTTKARAVEAERLLTSYSKEDEMRKEYESEIQQLMQNLRKAEVKHNSLKTAAIEWKARTVHLEQARAALAEEFTRNRQFHDSNEKALQSKIDRLRQDNVLESEELEEISDEKIRSLESKVRNLEEALQSRGDESTNQKYEEQIAELEARTKELEERLVEHVKESEQSARDWQAKAESLEADRGLEAKEQDDIQQGLIAIQQRLISEIDRLKTQLADAKTVKQESRSVPLEIEAVQNVEPAVDAEDMSAMVEALRKEVHEAGLAEQAWKAKWQEKCTLADDLIATSETLETTVHNLEAASKTKDVMLDAAENVVSQWEDWFHEKEAERASLAHAFVTQSQAQEKRLGEMEAAARTKEVLLCSAEQVASQWELYYQDIKASADEWETKAKWLEANSLGEANKRQDESVHVLATRVVELENKLMEAEETLRKSKQRYQKLKTRSGAPEKYSEQRDEADIPSSLSIPSPVRWNRRPPVASWFAGETDEGPQPNNDPQVESKSSSSSSSSSSSDSDSSNNSSKSTSKNGGHEVAPLPSLTGSYGDGGSFSDSQDDPVEVERVSPIGLEVSKDHSQSSGLVFFPKKTQRSTRAPVQSWFA
jgi:chromosome segregation ATPase